MRRPGFERSVVIATAALSALAVVLVVDAARHDRIDRSIRELLIIWVPVLVGLYAVRTTDSKRFGRLLIAAGLLWSLSALAESSASLPYSTGRLVAWLIFPVMMYLMLAFPRGRMHGRAERVVYGGVIAVIVLLYIGSALFVNEYPLRTPWASCRADCPPNAFLLLSSEPAVMDSVVAPARELLAIALVTAVAATLLARLAGASDLRRRQIIPVVIACLGSCLTLVAFLVVRRVAPHAPALDTLGLVWSLWLPALAGAFFIGLLRRRLRIAQVLERLSIGLSAPLDPRRLRATLARELADPGLEVLLPDGAPGQWRDATGQLSPDAVGDRAVTPVGKAPHVAALLVHDPSLHDDDELMDAVAALVQRVLLHDQTQARLARSLEQLTASRKQIATAANLERSRIERDLHDGAQQRLVALRIRLALAEPLLRSDLEAGLASVAELGDEVERALEEIRELAHGVHPPLLADSGLADALRSVSAEAPLPVKVQTHRLTRHPPEIETAVYFMSREAIQNAIKHASGASGVWVALREQPKLLIVEIRDDGAGFVPRGNGNGGLRNMRDRIEAIGGRLTIEAWPCRGTRVVATVPLAGTAT